MHLDGRRFEHLLETRPAPVTLLPERLVEKTQNRLRCLHSAQAALQPLDLPRLVPSQRAAREEQQ